MNNRDLGLLFITGLVAIIFVVLRIITRLLFDFGLLYILLGLLVGTWIFKFIVAIL